MANTKNYNRATKFFRDLEWADPYDKRWGEFADAMDEVISTFVPVVRCIDCKWRHTEACFCKAKDDVQNNWFCSEGEKADG